MRKGKFHYFVIIIVFLLSQFLFGCSFNEDKTNKVKEPAREQLEEKTAKQQAVPADQSLDKEQSRAPAVKAPPAPLVIEVNGKTLTREQLNKEIKKTMSVVKNQIPADKVDDYGKSLKKRMIEGFVSRALLTDEIVRKKIEVSKQELTDEFDKIQTTLPQGVTINEGMTKNNISKEKMNDDLRFSIQLKKLVALEKKRNIKPTDVEIQSYYESNKEKFKLPESVHARHILISKDSKDDDKAKAGKKAKAELIRKKLADGADFADLADKYSDCPSKKNGGDLGEFTKGQMIKPFERAAFSQKINEIGSVVETDFGYHIIEILDKKEATVKALDESLKNRISSVLEQQNIKATLSLSLIHI